MLVASAVASSAESTPQSADSTPPGPEAPATLAIQHVVPGLHVVSGAGGNVVVWSGGDAVVLVDDKLAASSEDLLQAVARIDPRPIRFVVNTHWHPDHTGGNERIGRAGGVVIAHANSRTRMSTEQFVAAYDKQVPPADPGALPVVTFDEEISLHLNGDRLDAVHVVSAHTDGDVIVWWNDADVVHMGDVFYSGAYPFIDRSSGGSLAGLVAAMEGVLSRADDGTVVIPGHGPLANRADLARYRDMVVAVGRRVRELIEQGRSVEEVLEARPTAPYDEEYGSGPMTPERFVRILYQDLAQLR
jgi:glyoxylase-like metal-dependent hydrolase (beta-lactamase superfamily II)